MPFRSLDGSCPGKMRLQRSLGARHYVSTDSHAISGEKQGHALMLTCCASDLLGYIARIQRHQIAHERSRV